jgi:hypothetical protein
LEVFDINLVYVGAVGMVREIGYMGVVAERNKAK